MATQNGIRFAQIKRDDFNTAYAVIYGLTTVGTVGRQGSRWYYETVDGCEPHPVRSYDTRKAAVAALVTAWETFQASKASKPAAPAPATVASKPATVKHGVCVNTLALAKPWHGLKRPDRTPVALIDTLLANDAAMQAVKARGLQYLVSLASERLPGCHDGYGVYVHGRGKLGIVAPLAFVDQPAPWRWVTVDGNTSGTEPTQDAAALALADACEEPKPAPSRGGGTLATILAFLMSFVGAFATGACSTVGTVGTVKPATVATVGDVQLQALKAANEAIKAERTTNVDADEADSDDGDCNRMAAPESDSDERDDDCDSADTCATGHPLSIHAASEREADAVESAVKARKPATVGSETITALCPGQAFKVWDMGRDWHFVCDANGTRIVAPKSIADAGLTAVTKGNASAGWVR